MKITCVNGWGGKLCDAFTAYVADDLPDILCLQEVVHSPTATKDWLTYRDGAHVLPQRANFLADVSKALPEHVAVFCPAARGVLWDGDNEVPSYWGLATFIHRRLPVVGQIQGFVHKAYCHDGYGDHPRSRTAHGIRVFDDSSSRFVCVTHMHGLRDLRGKMDTPARHAQAFKLLALSQRLTEPGDVSVLCGDFNVEPESETLRMLSAAGLTELVTSQGFTGTRTALYEKPGKFADYMLVNDMDAVRRFNVVDDPVVSDHCPLTLTL